MVDFANSKIERKLFTQHNMAHNDMCWASNPGPGVYDFDKPGHKNFHANGENTVFQSKVPNCKDAKIKSPYPPPGSYKVVKSIEADVKKKITKTSEGQFIGQEPQSFLSKTKRDDFWRNEIITPYTKQTFVKNPGPGTYHKDKKKEDIKNKTVLSKSSFG